MATFTVTTTADSGAGSLRQAVLDANAAPGEDSIVFDAAFDGGAEDLIRLTSGQIAVTGRLNIFGGPARVTITGDAAGDDVTDAHGITDVVASGPARLDDNSRIFDASAALELDGLVLTGGRTTGADEGGGAVRTTANLTLIDCMVSGNSTMGDGARGGGIYGGDDVTVANSIVRENITTGDFADGGGIGGRRHVTLSNSTVSDNSTTGEYAGGGGVFGFGDITLANSTVSGNSTMGDTSRGGGVYGNVGYGNDVTLANCTVSGNSTMGDTSSGGGVYGNDVTLANCTVSGNSTMRDTSSGSGVFGRDVTLTNSIVLGNATTSPGVGGDEAAGRVTRTGGNILGTNLFNGETDVGDVTVEEVFAATTEIAPGVLAGALADNGGPTGTILIRSDGPAADAGSATTLPIDQRGLERVFGAAVDLGAVEVGAGPAEPGSFVVTTALDVVANDGLTSLREAVFFANVEPGRDTISFDASVFDADAADVILLTLGEIAITDALTIDGGNGVTITGDAAGDDATNAAGITDVAASGADRLDDNSRIFDAIAALKLDGLVLTGGRTTGEGEGGGAVRASDRLVLIDCTVSGNSTTAGGGGIGGSRITLADCTVSGNSTTGYSAYGGGVLGGIVRLTNTTVSGNSTTGFYDGGGGIFGGTVTLTDSTVSGNSSSGTFGLGGGILGVHVTLTDSTVIGNSAATVGGGIRGRRVTLTDSTVSGNSAANRGGGVYAVGAVRAINSTISGNRAVGEGAEGGGIWSPAEIAGDRSPRIHLTNSILLGNAASTAASNEYAGKLVLKGGNIVGHDVFSGSADIGDTSAAKVFDGTVRVARGVWAGELADNGGPTETIALRLGAGNPAIGLADRATANTADQRGLPRDPYPDAGAFELQGLVLVGGPKPDQLTGWVDGDALYGQGGNDTLRGLGGDDRLFGGAGADRLAGGEGGDLLEGGGGRDLLIGGEGHDRLRGGPEADTLLGGAGSDRLAGNAGDDLLRGDAGADRFVFGQGFGRDTIADFDADPAGGQDVVNLRLLGISAANFDDRVTIADLGRDTLVTVADAGTILCRGITGDGANAIDASDFLLLA